jgi:hypothetical protein
MHLLMQVQMHLSSIGTYIRGVLGAENVQKSSLAKKR